MEKADKARLDLLVMEGNPRTNKLDKASIQAALKYIKNLEQRVEKYQQAFPSTVDEDNPLLERVTSDED